MESAMRRRLRSGKKTRDCLCMAEKSGNLRSKVQLISKCDTVTNQSLESTRRARELCQQTKATAEKIVFLLDEQDEKIQTQLDCMASVKTSMSEADRVLQESMHVPWCGICFLPWRRNVGMAQLNCSAALSSMESDMNEASPISGGPTAPNSPQSPNKCDAFLQSLLGDWREDEMESNLEIVDECVGKLRDMALEIGEDIDYQNRMLSRAIEQWTI